VQFAYFSPKPDCGIVVFLRGRVVGLGLSHIHSCGHDSGGRFFCLFFLPGGVAFPSDSLVNCNCHNSSMSLDGSPSPPWSGATLSSPFPFPPGRTLIFLPPSPFDTTRLPSSRFLGHPPLLKLHLQSFILQRKIFLSRG